MHGILTGYTVKYRGPQDGFIGDHFVQFGQQNTHEYQSLQVYTQYCVQVLGETKYGSGPEYYDGCVNVTTDEDGKTKKQTNKRTNKYTLY